MATFVLSFPLWFWSSCRKREDACEEDLENEALEEDLKNEALEEELNDEELKNPEELFGLFSLQDEPDPQFFLLEIMDPDFISMEELLLVVGGFLGDGVSLLWFSLRDSSDDIPDDVLQL